MKTLLILSTLVLSVVTGIMSYLFFTQADYYTSALLTITAYLSISAAVNLINIQLNDTHSTQVTATLK